MKSLNEKLIEKTRKTAAKRAAAGLCRHCGGPVPCWSIFGDQAPGKYHTPKSHARRMQA